jgi:hypothetical protein
MKDLKQILHEEYNLFKKDTSLQHEEEPTTNNYTIEWDDTEEMAPEPEQQEKNKNKHRNNNQPIIPENNPPTNNNYGIEWEDE